MCAALRSSSGNYPIPVLAHRYGPLILPRRPVSAERAYLTWARARARTRQYGMIRSWNRPIRLLKNDLVLERLDVETGQVLEQVGLSAYQYERVQSRPLALPPPRNPRKQFRWPARIAKR